jgi:hypothetical protein
MFTSRFTKPVIGTALAAGTLGLAAVLAAGTANAGAADDQFLAALQQQGIGFVNADMPIYNAHSVCTDFDNGIPLSRIEQSLAPSGLDAAGARKFVVIAAEAYCPQYVR